MLVDDPECAPDILPRATICVLLYGDYPELARRCLNSILQYAPRNEYLLRIGMNACCRETIDFVELLSRDVCLDMVVNSKTNLHKYPMMRKLLWDKPIETDWIVWFDDDAHILSEQWWIGLWPRLAHPEIMAAGELWWKPWEPGQWEFIQGRPWYRGLPPQTHRRYRNLGITFMTGSYWIIRSDRIRLLNWPEEYLVTHGDALLGEAIRQQGWRYIHYAQGVKTNHAPTRTVWLPEPGSRILTLPPHRQKQPSSGNAAEG